MPNPKILINTWLGCGFGTGTSWISITDTGPVAVQITARIVFGRVVCILAVRFIQRLLWGAIVILIVMIVSVGSALPDYKSYLFKPFR